MNSARTGRDGHRARQSDLLDIAVAHQNDAVGQAHRLLLVMRHQQGRDAQRALDALDLVAHGRAQIEIERRPAASISSTADVASARQGHACRWPPDSVSTGSSPRPGSRPVRAAPRPPGSELRLDLPLLEVNDIAGDAHVGNSA
jgi:hypothetical protein